MNAMAVRLIASLKQNPVLSYRQWGRYGWYMLLLALFFCCAYVVVLMYARGEHIFALMTLLFVSSGVYIFTHAKTYAHRYIFPGVLAVSVFMILPITYTVKIAFSNYSGQNMLPIEQAYRYLLEQKTYQVGHTYPFTLFKNEKEQYKIILEGQSGQLETPFFNLHKKNAQNNQHTRMMMVKASDHTELKQVALREIIQLRKQLTQLDLVLPDPRQTQLQMSSLRRFSAVTPVYQSVPKALVFENGQVMDDPWLIKNIRTGQMYRPNLKTGFFQAIGEQGAFLPESLAPGFVVAVGWKNFVRIATESGLTEPFLQILIWTLIFSVCTVVLKLFLGLTLASIVQWELLRGRSIYRVLLILPYAVPAFISILVFKGLFNQNFGEINLFLESTLGIKPHWFTDPILAKVMILIVNLWLAYPYMMLLSMGLLKSIPEELYEASAMDGAGPISNFFYITLPMVIRPMIPLLIAVFAFNFNNFVLIQLLTEGKPDIIGASTPAGTTDLLVNYTYRIAFEGSSGQDYGLASAIATLIFLIIGGLSLFNLKLSKVKN